MGHNAQNHTLKVKRMLLILGSSQFAQVAFHLDDDTNWNEIKWPTRKKNTENTAAKVLLFGGKYGENRLLSPTLPASS